MTLVHIPSEWADSADVDQIGALAAFFHIAALSWSNRALANGFIPDNRVTRLVALDDAPGLIKRLVDAGLWERVEGGYQITAERGLLQWQRTRDQVEDDRAKHRVRQARYITKQRDGVTDAVTNGVADGVIDSVADGPSTSTSTSSLLNSYSGENPPISPLAKGGRGGRFSKRETGQGPVLPEGVSPGEWRNLDPKYDPLFAKRDREGRKQRRVELGWTASGVAS